MNLTMLQTYFSSITLSPRPTTEEARRTGTSPAKRVIDVIGAGCGLAMLSPLLALIALLIRLGSRGPILFRQDRMGRDGRVFSCLKFRTMVPDAESKLRELEALNEMAGGVCSRSRTTPESPGSAVSSARPAWTSCPSSGTS